MLDGFQEQWPFLWHSEHLSYQTIPGRNGGPTGIGTPLPLPGTAEAAHLVGARAAVIGRRYGVPFLLENPAHYLTELPYELEIGDEIGLMAAITEHGRCGQLLGPLPPLSDRQFPVLFAPGLPKLYRAANNDEVAVWERLARPTAVPLLSRDSNAQRVIERLFSIGAADLIPRGSSGAADSHEAPEALLLGAK